MAHQLSGILGFSATLRTLPYRLKLTMLRVQYLRMVQIEQHHEGLEDLSDKMRLEEFCRSPQPALPVTPSSSYPTSPPMCFIRSPSQLPACSQRLGAMSPSPSFLGFHVCWGHQMRRSPAAVNNRISSRALETEFYEDINVEIRLGILTLNIQFALDTQVPHPPSTSLPPVH